MLWAVVIGLGLPTFAYSGAAGAKAPIDNSNRIEITREVGGPVIEFRDGDFVLSNSLSRPTLGWTRQSTPRIYRLIDTKWRMGETHTLWARHSFDRATLQSGPFALYTVSTRNQFVVYLNGVEVFRNFADDADQKNTWYRPYLIQLPERGLKAGINEILVRAVSQESVGVGRIVIGPRAHLEDYYNRQFFWRISAPTIASSSMLLLGLFALVLWFQRREEVELGYLAASTVLYFLRNLNYFAEDVPFHMATFSGLTVAATLLSMVTTFAFYIAFLRVPRFQTIIAIMIATVILTLLCIGIFS
jgi:hypothetical protein